MKLLLDVNFGASWVEELRELGIDSTYWAHVGVRGAADDELFGWSRANEHVLLTQDLGIATHLVTAGARGPSVIQVRFVDDAHTVSCRDVAAAVRRHRSALAAGAI